MRKSLKIITLVIALTLIMSMFTACSFTEVVTGLKGAMANVSAIIISIKNSFLGSIPTVPNTPVEPECEHIWFVASCSTPQTCSVCGETKGQALSHTEVVDPAVAPTCTTSGLTEGKHCSACNTIIVAQKKLDALSHTLTSVTTKEPTCTEGGSKQFTCSVCQHSYVEDLPPLGHTFSVTVIEPTCTTGGYSLHTCSICGYIFRDIFTDPTDENHEYGEGVVTVPAQCGVKGTMTYTCTVSGCDKTRAEDIAPLSHDYEDRVVAPTCTEHGYTLHTCKRGCGYSYMDNTTSPIGHDYVITEVVAPSCTEMGHTVNTCNNCSHSYNDKYTAPAHVFESIITEPTCTDKGFVTHTCKLCDTVVIDTFTAIEPDNHDLVLSDDETKETCSHCGFVLYHSDVNFGAGAAGSLYYIPEGSVISEELLKSLDETALKVDSNGLSNLAAGTYVLSYTEEGNTKYRYIQIDNKEHTTPVDDVKDIIFIDNLTELKAFRDSVNAGNKYSGAKVLLTSNIDLGNEEWAPIGHAVITNNNYDWANSPHFAGSFDGQGLTISNLYINQPETNIQGFFGYGKLTEVKNITFHNASVVGLRRSAVLVGQNDGSMDVSNVHFTGDIKVEVIRNEAGTVVGRGGLGAISDVTVNANEGSYVKCSTTNNASWEYVGGVWGHAWPSTANNITSNIDVFAYASSTGGIGGGCAAISDNITCTGDVTLTIKDAEIHTGTIECWQTNGLIYGFGVTASNTSTHKFCSSTGTLTLGGTAVTDLALSGVVTGYAANDARFGAPYKSSGIITLFPLVDFGGITEGTVISLPEGYSAITSETLKSVGAPLSLDANGLANLSIGTHILVYDDNGTSKYKIVVIEHKAYESSIVAKDVHFINDLAEFKAFRDSVNAGSSYAGSMVYLLADIDLGNEEWTPIGTKNSPFSGSFDGQGHTISNLYINKEIGNIAASNRQGLFGTVVPVGATYMKNFTLHNANVTAGYHVGAVLATSDGSSQKATGNYFVMTNIKLTGKVTVEGWQGVAGVMGSGNMAEFSNIEINTEPGSYVSNLKGGEDNAFSIVGSAKGGGYLNIIKNVTSNLDVSGKTASIGGLFGIVGGQTNPCYISDVTYSGTVTVETSTKLQWAYGRYSYNGLIIGAPRFTVIADRSSCTSTGKLVLKVEDGVYTGNDMDDVFTWGADLFGASRDNDYTDKSYSPSYVEN